MKTINIGLEYTKNYDTFFVETRSGMKVIYKDGHSYYLIVTLDGKEHYYDMRDYSIFSVFVIW